MERKQPTEPVTDMAKFMDFANGKIASDHLAAIGTVAAKWSLFEALIDTASVRLARITPEIGVCFTAQIAGSARKLDAYISLSRFRHISEEMIADLTRFAKKTHDLSLMRNRIIHDVWVFDASMSPQRLEVTAKQVSKIESVSMSTREVMDFADRLDRHTKRFENYADTIEARGEAPPAIPLPDIRR